MEHHYRRAGRHGRRQTVTTPPPPPVGQIIFDGTWEQNPPPVSYDSNPLTRPGWSVVPGAFSAFDDAAGRSVAITLPGDGTTAAFEAYKDSYLSTPLETQQGARARVLGSTEFYGFRWRFPTGWQSPSSWGAMIAQLAYPALRYHGWGLVAEADRVRLALNTGFIDWGPGGPTINGQPTFGYSYQNGPAIPINRFELNKWHYLICEIKWATTFTGLTNIWHRKTGEGGWTQTIALANIPTQQWGKGYDQATNPDREMDVNGLRVTSGHPYLLWDKFGFYAGPTNYAKTIHSGGFCVGTTFAAVEAKLGF